MITLNLNNNTITLNTHNVEGKTLYKAQDLLNGYGLDVQKTKDTIRHWKDSMTKKCGAHFAPHSIQRGKQSGTYLTKRQILKLAGYVDYAFEDAVYEAFEALAEGKVAKAQAIAETTVEIHEATLIKKPRARIRTFLAQFEDISEGVECWIKGMKNNTKATYEDRVRTLKSLTTAVNESYDVLPARNLTGAAQHERALKMIAQEERYQARLAMN